jgi:AcrR family transcriptional regulator
VLTRAEQQARTRRRVLDAATEVFAERGLAASTVSEIAERADFTRGAVYSNFRNKEDLALALIEERIEVFLQVLVTVREGPSHLSPGIATFTEQFDDFFLGPVPQLFHEFRAHAVRRPDLRERLARLYEPLMVALTEALRELSPTLGQPRYASGLAALANGVSMEALANPELARDPELFGDLVLAISRGLEASGPDKP